MTRLEPTPEARPGWWPPQDGDRVVERVGVVWRYNAATGMWSCASRILTADTETMMVGYGPMRLVSRGGKPAGS